MGADGTVMWQGWSGVDCNEVFSLDPGFGSRIFAVGVVMGGIFNVRETETKDRHESGMGRAGETDAYPSFHK